MSNFSDYKPHGVSSHPQPERFTIRPAAISDVPELALIKSSREGTDLNSCARGFAEEISRNGNSYLLLTASIGTKIAAFGRAGFFQRPESISQNTAPEGWYLLGVIVLKDFRRCGIAFELTRSRLLWIADHSKVAYYFASAMNLATIHLHNHFGFSEITRDFTFPGVTFTGGTGILFRAELNEKRIQNCARS
ncbi:MAG: GNAT family N-acetyltransferase [Candidatus Eremiobacteraeota bacterium]|nr:GNAT family N-acetyltransferase [Candidatus Eremiobacteraeota bacterium]